LGRDARVFSGGGFDKPPVKILKTRFNLLIQESRAMRKSEERKLRLMMERARERAQQKRDEMDKVKPMAGRLLLMMLWAKVTGRG
jgi:hypothetical protein